MRKINNLTTREYDVLVLMCEKLTNEEISRKLAVSKKTVNTYTSSIYEKLNVGNRREAIEKAKEIKGE